MKVCIIGQGYIGLPTAALFAKNNCEVVGVDVNKTIVDNLNKGIIHIEEPGISDIIKNAVKNEVYTASLTPQKADAFIITVSVSTVVSIPTTGFVASFFTVKVPATDLLLA